MPVTVTDPNSPDVVVDEALIHALTAVERRWSRDPETWDATYDQLLALQWALQEGSLPLAEIMWQARGLLLQLGFVRQADRVARASYRVDLDESVPPIPPAYEPPPQPDRPSQNQSNQPQSPPQHKPTIGQRARSTVHLVSTQLAADDGAPLLGIGGVSFLLAAAVKSRKRRRLRQPQQALLGPRE